MKKKYRVKKIELTLIVDEVPKLKRITENDITGKPQKVLMIADLSKNKKDIIFKPFLEFFKIT